MLVEDGEVLNEVDPCKRCRGLRLNGPCNAFAVVDHGALETYLAR